MHDLSRLGGWADLPFFRDDLPRIEAALGDGPVLPPAAVRFRALELVQPGAARVVILGQDPYHTAGKADGLAFSIPEGFGGRTASLGNIFREIETDVGGVRTRTDLTDWAAQGVLLLNTALTVPEGRAKGHARLGWDRLVRQVLARAGAARPLAAILWGGEAQRFRGALPGEGHLVVESAHPSPLSAWKGFFGSRPFGRVNAWRAARGETEVDWVGD